MHASTFELLAPPARRSLARPARRTSPGAPLFVYGTLLPHAPAHWLLAGLTDHGAASVAGRLYTLGAYPALRPAPGSGERVHGRLYGGLDARTLAVLDRFEDFRPHAPARGEYRRVACTVRLADGRTRRAWTYRHNRAWPARRRVPDGRWRPDAVR